MPRKYKWQKQHSTPAQVDQVAKSYILLTLRFYDLRRKVKHIGRSFRRFFVMGNSSRWWPIKIRHSELSMGVHVDLGESGRITQLLLHICWGHPEVPCRHIHMVCSMAVSAHVLLPQEHACLHTEQAKNAKSSSPGRVLSQWGAGVSGSPQEST